VKILFNDIIQYSDIPFDLKNPALSQIYSINNSLVITLDKVRPINAIGIGNTDSTIFTISIGNKSKQFNFSENGLYLLGETFNVNKFTITTNGSYIGRIGAGIGVNIPTAIAKEPAFNSTAEPRTTLSGQVIPGAGGYTYRSISLDSRYKIGELAMKEIESGYKYIGMGYPFFIDLSVESYKLPFSKLYAIERNQRQMSFEGGIRRFLYSRRFEFEERF